MALNPKLQSQRPKVQGLSLCGCNFGFRAIVLQSHGSKIPYGLSLMLALAVGMLVPRRCRYCSVLGLRV